MNWDAQNARPQLITDKIGMVGSCFQHFPPGSSFEHFPMPIQDLHNHGSFCKHFHDASIHNTTTTSHTTSCIRQVCVCVIVDQYPLLDIGFYDFTTFGCSAIGFLHQILVGIGDLGDDWCWDLVLGRRLVRLRIGVGFPLVTNFGLGLGVGFPLVTNFGLAFGVGIPFGHKFWFGTFGHKFCLQIFSFHLTIRGVCGKEELRTPSGPRSAR